VGASGGPASGGRLWPSLPRRPSRPATGPCAHESGRSCPSHKNGPSEPRRATENSVPEWHSRALRPVSGLTEWPPPRAASSSGGPDTPQAVPMDSLENHHGQKAWVAEVRRVLFVLCVVEKDAHRADTLGEHACLIFGDVPRVISGPDAAVKRRHHALRQRMAECFYQLAVGRSQLVEFNILDEYGSLARVKLADRKRAAFLQLLEELVALGPDVGVKRTWPSAPMIEQ
jgi:hypothetical protein